MISELAGKLSIPIPRLRIPRSWGILIALDFCLIAFAIAQDNSLQGQSGSTTDRPVYSEIEDLGSHSTADVRFDAIDVFVDSGDDLLAAYQLEFLSDAEGVVFVGIEGGEHPAFLRPPYYDPRAMNNNRVILASFNAGLDLPKGRSRVARIHIQMSGPASRKFQTSLMASATRDGRPIPADISISRVVR